MLHRNDTALLVIDIQDKLVRVMHDEAALLDKASRLIQGAQIIGLPILVTEQYPRGLGTTVKEIVGVLESYNPLEKRVFGCCDDTGFVEQLEQAECKNLLVCGIETHVCVYQTVSQLLENQYHVEVVADAVDSRTPFDKHIGLERMQTQGAFLSTAEMALFELQQVAQGEQFKAISSVIK